MLKNILLPGGRPVRGLLLFVVLLSIAGAGVGAPRIIDRIDVGMGRESNNIQLIFNVPVRVISQVLSSTKRELNIQVQPTITPGTGEELLSRDEVLSWNPSAEIPLDKIRFRPRLIGTSLLELSFVVPVEASIVQKRSDFFSLTIVLKKKKPVERIVLPEPPIDQVERRIPERDKSDGSTQDSKTPPARLADGLFTINLVSQTRPIDFSKVSPVPVPEGSRLYTTEATVDGRTWYRLRMGFYTDANTAGKALKGVRHFYPRAWIDKATPDEKSRIPTTVPDALITPSDAVEKRRKPSLRLPKRSEDPAASGRLSRMMTATRKMMTAGDFPKAIRMLTAILEQPKHSHTREAQELLGLARERNGQLTHAFAEYEKYLQEYPDGEDAERVRQRLSGLATASRKPRQPLRKPRAEEKGSPWEVFGSLSLAYRRDGIESELVDESVTRSQIDSDLYLSARREVADGDLRLQLTGGYSYDLLDNGPGDVTTLSDAYVEYEHRPTDTSVKLGRQRLRSSGILSRFDGVVLGHGFSRDVEAHLSFGVPVEKTSDTSIRSDKYFFGLNLELDSVLENTDVNLFFVEQDVEGLVDRRAIGAEVRYFKDDLSVFGLIDYDLFFNELNTVLVQTNWNLSQQTALYLILDYRLTPTLTASNARTGQSVSDMADLRNLFSDDEIYDLARDRTARSKIASIGGTHTLANGIQLSGDLTYSNVGSTPASGGVDAGKSTGNEFFYTAQMSKPNFIKKGDIGIASLRYVDASESDTITLTAESRYPVTSLLRINPRVSLSYRESKNEDSSRATLGLLVRGDYRLRRNLLLEGELGVNLYDEDNNGDALKFTDYFLRFGFRLEF